MKLKLSGTGTGFGKIRDAETNHLVASDVRHVDAVEIIRRVNAHEALVNFCKATLVRIEGSIVNQDLRDAGNAALALSEKGE